LELDCLQALGIKRYTLDPIMEPNDRFKIPISLLSIATITVAAILLTIFVMNHEHVQPGVEAVLIFAVIFFGPVTLLCVLFIEGWPIDIGTLISVFALPTSALAALLARACTPGIRPV